mmetsp:Transcript_5951/g.8059  ORF Transcript_5951/g.8059 Transcript_5951/m.8059 type:complete len:102 (-) Transcript_5951:679-984(-)
MHQDVLWFDTAACWTGRFIGNINTVVIKANTQQYTIDPTKTYTRVEPAADANSGLDGTDQTNAAFGKSWASWYAGTNYSVDSPKKDWQGQPAYNELAPPID